MSVPKKIVLQATIYVPVETVISYNRNELTNRLKRDLKIARAVTLANEFPDVSPVLEDIQFTARKMIDDCHTKNIEFDVTANAFPF